MDFTNVKSFLILVNDTNVYSGNEKPHQVFSLVNMLTCGITHKQVRIELANYYDCDYYNTPFIKCPIDKMLIQRVSFTSCNLAITVITLMILR